MSYSTAKLYTKFSSLANRLQSPLLLLIRLFWGGSLFVTGIGKFTHLGKVSAFFETLAIPFPEMSAFITATIETVGGACLFVGLASRLVSIPIICTLIVAFLTADSEAVRMIFSDPQNFIHRDPFSFLFAAILVLIFGPGRVSLDRWILGKKKITY